MPINGQGWAGTVGEFLSCPYEVWLDSLIEHHRRLMAQGPASSQIEAWAELHEVVADALRSSCSVEPAATEWGVVFEYELPLEGGRRPDVTVLAGGSIVVLEFKSTTRPTQAQVDQVAAYGRDLADYHEATHGRTVKPVLVLPRAVDDYALEADGVVVTGPDGLSRYLHEYSARGTIDLDEWLRSPYRPLPTLVAAARRIFRHEPLPHVRRALAAGIPETLDLLSEIVRRAAERGERAVAFITGVPGAGKTLVGLRFVYERSGEHERALLLSGNGPLVQVLQDALRSREFVRDLHAFIRTYGINRRMPGEHIVVFDEAQRAWDRHYMLVKRGVDRSEPDLLVDIGHRMPRWSALVGLVGEGQHIYTGEEGGMAQWGDAIASAEEPEAWRVHCPPHLASHFPELAVEEHERLHLSLVVRARRAEDIHEWVGLVLEGSLPLAARKAVRFFSDVYQMYLTRDLQDAKNYALGRYVGHPDARYGLLASSHANWPQRYGLDNGFPATRKVKVGRWFNAEQDDPLSSCALEQPITEFQCQGLELDLPIVCWGEDVVWDGRM
ncbi:MAG: DNA/RNA helicase domain-containing protein, partial [Actinomycetota bacterium]